MKKSLFLFFMHLLLSLSIGAQTIGEAFYIYRNDGAFNAFFREEVDSMVYSYYDVDSILHTDIVTQVVYTPDSIYHIPLATIDSVGFVTPETKYKSGVKLIKDKLREYVVSAQDMTITFADNTPPELLPLVGDKLVTLEMSDMFPIGFAGKVIHIESNKGYVVVCDTVDLTTIFERYYSTFSANMLADTTKNESKTRTYPTPHKTSFDGDIWLPSYFGSIDLSGSIDITEDVPFSLGTSFNTELRPSCHVKCTFIVDSSVGMYLNASIITDVTANENLSLSGSIGVSHDFPIGRPFNYPLIPLVNFYAEMGAFIDVSAQLCWGTSFMQHYRKYWFITYDLLHPENNQCRSLIKHLETNHSEKVLTGSGYIKAGFYAETGLNVVCKELSKIGLRGEFGIKAELNALARRSDFENTQSSTRLYDIFNADRSISMGCFGGVKFVGRVWKFSDSVGKETHIEGNLFDGGLVPRFSELYVEQGKNPSTITASAAISRNCLFPVKVGFQLLDETDSPICSKYNDEYYRNEEFSMFNVTFDGITASKKYHIRPIVYLFENELLASPKTDIDINFPITLSDFKVTKSQYKKGGFTNDGITYDYCFNVSIKVKRDAVSVSDWGYVYEDSNSQRKRISLKSYAQVYVDTRYAYYRNEPHSTCRLYGYVKYVGDSEYYYGEPVDYELIYEEENYCPDSHHPHVIDMGEAGLWACCNVGASKPEEYGDYFAWGETTGYNFGKTYFDWNTYKYSINDYDTLTKYCNESIYGYNGFTDNLTELLPEDDAATANWGSEWRMPTKEQFGELVNSSYTTTEWTTVNSIYGRKITSKSTMNSIFLPAAGCRDDSSLYSVGSNGDYWSRTLSTLGPGNARNLSFDPIDIDADYFHPYRYYGQSVRPVHVSQ